MPTAAGVDISLKVVVDEDADRGKHIFRILYLLLDKNFGSGKKIKTVKLHFGVFMLLCLLPASAFATLNATIFSYMNCGDSRFKELIDSNARKINILINADYMSGNQMDSIVLLAFNSLGQTTIFSIGDKIFTTRIRLEEKSTALIINCKKPACGSYLQSEILFFSKNEKITGRFRQGEYSEMTRFISLH